MNTTTLKTCFASLGLLASLAVALAPNEAEACGGTFCDAGPTAMPVDQTGENILFVMGEGQTEAHIQIQYDPDAEADEFAWVVPLMAVPEFEVGSQPMFDAVLGGTVPSYGFQTVFNGNGCNSGTGGGGGGTTGGGGGGDDTAGPGPDIVLQTVVGAFEVTVLQGGTADELVMWLDDNGYQQDPEALPIFDAYLAENYLFAAFRLTNDAETADIHPIVLRFPVEEACVPLRLTRIAAVEDMNIRTFFLADSRVVPQSYKHVEVNPLKLDWPNRAANYSEVITLAVDADEANGRAFVTEYAGPSDVVSTGGLHQPAWDAAAFEAAPAAVQAIELLKAQGLLTCDFTFELQCTFNHPLLPSIVEQYLPVPQGADDSEYYDDPLAFEGFIDPTVWDGLAFSTLLDERIIAPGLHAQTILSAYPTLTRMYTTISPGEMTEDPFFHENPDLPEVDHRSDIATREVDCGPDEVWTLPDGREVFVPGGVWPDFDAQMPWEEEVQEIAMAGAPIVLVDQTQVIDAGLFEHNCQYDYPSAEVCGNPPGATSGTGSGGGASGGTGDTGATGSGSAGQDDDSAGGCGCRSGAPGRGGALLLGLSLLGLRVRRRRAS
ncbi:MAG: DUF2330 domain-containing protein [Deltaproteobacteria bacterium]|nr:DUF2330 domain-containing protein [Deltaproteobacteria bacterium]